MKLKSFFVFFAAVLFLPACESSVTNPPSTIDDSTTLAYRGGLNTTFDKSIQEFNKSVRVVSQINDSYILDIQFNVRTLDEVQSQQATVQFDIPFTSEDGIFPVGNYVLTNEQIKSAYGDYELVKNNSDFARFNFEGVSATIIIDESDSQNIKGSFILNLKQIYGKRMTDGQLEEVILTSPTRLQSHFNLEY